MARESPKSYPWIGFGVRFACGAILGVLVGFGICSQWSADGLWIITVAALICGILAAVLGDGFWIGWFGPS